MNERIPKLAHNILLSVAASEMLVNTAQIVGMSKSAFVEHLIMLSEADDGAGQNKETPEKFIKRIKKRYRKPGGVLGFDAFWDSYPRKTAKKAAEDAYRRLSPEERNAAFLALGPYAESRAGQEPKFTPHASTWLNQRRWEDTAEAAKTTETKELAIKAESDRRAKEQADAMAEIREMERNRKEHGL